MVRMTFTSDTIRKNGSLVPRQVQQTKMEFDKVLSLMRISTGLSESDMRAVFQKFAEHLALYLPDGYRIQTPFGTFSLSLRQSGTSLASTDGSEVVIDRSVSIDRLSVRLKADKAMVAQLKAKTTLEIVDSPALQVPVVFYAENTEAEGKFNRGSAGDVLHVCGNRLSFAKSDAQLGVFFVGVTTPGETRAPSYSRIGTNFVDCKIPALTPGEYTLEVRTKPGKEIRVGKMDAVVTV